MFLNTDFLRDDEIVLTLERTAAGDAARGWVPAYHFAICNPAGEKMGACDLRIGHNDLLYYGGNIGYRIEEPYRGHHYAAKACRLLFALAKRHGLGYVIITCNPDNFASRKTCAYAGGTLLEIVDLPQDSDMRQHGETQKCIYRWEL
ncbi:MAG: GNAT family N-acetyltransferase [Hominenteromicrobium sp.]